MAARPTSTARTGETEIRLTARPRRDRGGASDAPGSGSSITCSTCWPATGGLDLDVRATGDLQTGAHHTVEDVGICLGQALDPALGDRAGIVRYGQATVPMDESRAVCAIDISGRGCVFEGELPPGAIGNFDHELTEEFLRALAANARLPCTCRSRRGRTPIT